MCVLRPHIPSSTESATCSSSEIVINEDSGDDGAIAITAVGSSVGGVLLGTILGAVIACCIMKCELKSL